MAITNLRDQLKRDEGEVFSVYLDSRGIRTAGVGHNMEAHRISWPVGTAISQDLVDTWLDEDIATASTALASALPWVDNLDPARHGVLLNMTFNMGIGGLLAFHRTLTLVEDAQYGQAAEAMLQSLWAKQVDARAKRLANQMSTGVWT